MTRALLRVATRQSDVDLPTKPGQARDLEDGKGIARGLDPRHRGEGGGNRVARDAEDLEIVVLDDPSEDRVTHRSANQKHATALHPKRAGAYRDALWNLDRAGGSEHLADCMALAP